MKRDTITIKYTEAISEYAAKNDSFDKIKQDFDAIKPLVWDNLDARAYLLYPETAREDKESLLEQIKKHLKLDEGIFKFILLLLKENRFQIFPDIYDAFLSDYQEYKKQILVNIKTAFSLTGEQEEEITKTLKKLFKKELVVTKAIDRDLLAGAQIILVNENLKIDLSARNALNKMERELAQ